jgi:hypothetical protein
MNRTYLILILIMMWLLCSSRTCTEDRNLSAVNESKAMSATKDSIRMAFAAGHPDEDLLRAYEETARLKLTDFADYLKIVSDTSLNIKFREQAAEMVRRLFVNGDTKVRNWAKAYSENDIPTLNELLAKGLSKGFTLWIQPEQVHVSAPLAVRDDSTYTGRLSCNQKCMFFNVMKSPSPISQITYIDFYLIKRVKSFGDESMIVWDVYLGNIN